MAKTRYLTTTLLPVPDGGRKKSCSNKHEVAHYWSANKQESGRAGNVFFENGTIYSYGYHFAIARHVLVRKTKQRVIFFTTRDYSSSTSSHKSSVSSAIPRGATVVECYNPRADAVEDHRENLAWFEKKAIDHLKESNEPRKREHTKAALRQNALDFIRRGNAYAEIVGLPDRIGSPEGGDLVAWATKVQAEAVAQQKRSQEAAKRKQAKELKQWYKDLEAWQAGADKVLRKMGSLHPEYGKAFVRVSRGKFLQTTLGMTIPLKEVMPVLEHIRDEAIQKVEGFGLTATGFKIQDWEGKCHWQDRFFVIGCHRITFDEILRAATVAGL